MQVSQQNISLQQIEQYYSSLRYLVAAPVSLRLDAEETVFVQLFGYTVEARISIFLKTSMAPGYKVLARADVTLNSKNNHQATAKVRVRHGRCL